MRRFFANARLFQYIQVDGPFGDLGRNWTIDTGHDLSKCYSYAHGYASTKHIVGYGLIFDTDMSMIPG